MKFRNLLSASLLALGLTGGCGYYTNFPAQYHIVQNADYPLTAEVAYTVDGAKVTYSIKNPKLLLEAEPGSIGVTFNTLTIDYGPTTIAAQLPRTTVYTTMRVGTSNYRDKDNKYFMIGYGVSELPVINTKVVSIGTPPSGVTFPITASIQLDGTDDAGFPAYFEFKIPINFTYASAK